MSCQKRLGEERQKAHEEEEKWLVRCSAARQRQWSRDRRRKGFLVWGSQIPRFFETQGCLERLGEILNLEVESWYSS